MQAPQLTLGTGILLTIIGLAGFMLTGFVHYTALIPSAFGVLLLVCGWVSKKPAARTPAIWIAAILGLAGLMGSSRGLAQLPALTSGETVTRPAAVIAQSAMFFICALFLVLLIFAAAKGRSKTPPAP